MLEDFVGLVDDLREKTAALEQAVSKHDADPLRHARHIKTEVRPAMAALRAVADELETQVASDLWPMPTYRELLFIKG
jgi:glutamine synthetase